MFFTLTINFRSYFYAFTYFSSCRRNQPPALKHPSWGLQYFRVKFSEKIVWSWSEHFFIHKLLENSRICRENHHCENNHCATTTLCSCRMEIHWKYNRVHKNATILGSIIKGSVILEILWGKQLSTNQLVLVKILSSG